MFTNHPYFTSNVKYWVLVKYDISYCRTGRTVVTASDAVSRGLRRRGSGWLTGTVGAQLVGSCWVTLAAVLVLMTVEPANTA